MAGVRIPPSAPINNVDVQQSADKLAIEKPSEEIEANCAKTHIGYYLFVIIILAFKQAGTVYYHIPNYLDFNNKS